MNRRRLAPLLPTVLLAASCATVSVATDYDHTADFSRYHTFRVVGGQLNVNGVSDEGNTLVKDRIHRTLVTVLATKGLREVPPEGAELADLLVGYWAGARTRTEIEGMPPYAPEMGPYWYGGWWGPGYTQWWMRTYEEGTLVIDLVDRATRKLVWRAYARREVKAPVDEQKVLEIIEKAFKAYPPRP
jgi:hypothetical protein